MPEIIIRLVRDGRVELYLSRFILEETAGVLSRPKFGWSAPDIAEALRSFPYRIAATARRRLSVVPDPSDNRILECAVASKAEFLITGDRHLLEVESYFRTRIVTPRQFLRALADRG